MRMTFFFQISVKYDEMRRQDKNWKGKTEPEKQSLWVDAALQVIFLTLSYSKKLNTNIGEAGS